MPNIPDAQFYCPMFSPWRGYGDFLDYYREAKERTLLVTEKCYFLCAFFQQTTSVLGDVAECGVYRGGTARMIAKLIQNKCNGKKHLHLFDTFTGIPVCNPEIDCVSIGTFGDVAFDEVRKWIGYDDFVKYHVGIMPQTFAGLENLVFSFVHIDVDMYRSYLDCLAFFWPRLSAGGIMVFDDYGHPSCPGARKATDEFFSDKDEKAIAIHEGQAFAIKLR